MAFPATKTSVRDRVSKEEWTVRTDLAALYRLVALNGWTDLIFTHISARVPGKEHHFLINPYGWYFDEITASSLVKVDLDGKIVMDTPYYDQPGRLRHPQRGARGARGRALRHAHAHALRGRGVDAEERPAADVAAGAAAVHHRRLPRLRRAGGQRRREEAAGGRPRAQQQAPDPAEPRAPERGLHRRRGVPLHVRAWSRRAGSRCWRSRPGPS